MITWHDEFNAQVYDTYTQLHPLYHEAGTFLIALAGLCPGMTVMDLACGTGVVTAQIAHALGSTGEIIGVDFSDAMLAFARKKVPTARFLCSPAEQVDAVLPASSVDAVVCNAAFWQLRAKETLNALSTILKPRGRLAFNLGTSTYLVRPATTPSLSTLIQRIAHDEYGVSTPLLRRRREKPLLSYTSSEISLLLAQASFLTLRHETVEIAYSEDGLRDFLKIPVMASHYLPGCEYDTSLAIMEKACQQATQPLRAIGLWQYYLAEKQA